MTLRYFITHLKVVFWERLRSALNLEYWLTFKLGLCKSLIGKELKWTNHWYLIKAVSIVWYTSFFDRVVWNIWVVLELVISMPGITLSILWFIKGCHRWIKPSGRRSTYIARYLFNFSRIFSFEILLSIYIDIRIFILKKNNNYSIIHIK